MSPPVPSASGIPGASAEASGAAVREPAQDAVPCVGPPADPRLDESSVDLDGPLRATWDRDRSADGLEAPASGSAEGAGPADSGQPAPGDVPDTEQLRLLMHRYRDLFNHICQP